MCSRAPQSSGAAGRVPNGRLRGRVLLDQYVRGAKGDGDEDKASRASIDHVVGAPAGSFQYQSSVLPSQVWVQIREQSLRSPQGELPCSVRDVRVEHSSDPWPMWSDEAFVRRSELDSDRSKACFRVIGKGGCGIGKCIAEDASQTGANLLVCRAP
ncbi:hypothetical protein GCM10009602_32870 [Nocardiopsis tropica]